MGNEHATFMGNHQALKIEMERINKDRNALRALTVKGFLPHLGNLNHKFEDIQKKLSQFLKTKRAQFPRFYFLSNEDLLEIIG
jgi:dynein heavy chain